MAPPGAEAPPGAPAGAPAEAPGFADDPVVAALRRYRAAAGASFGPRAAEEVPCEAVPDALRRLRELQGLLRREPLAASRAPPGGSACSSGPRPGSSGLHGGAFASAVSAASCTSTEDVASNGAVCSLGASLDFTMLIPSWLSWMNPWQDMGAPDLCSAPVSSVWVTPASGVWSAPGSDLAGASDPGSGEAAAPDLGCAEARDAGGAGAPSSPELLPELMRPPSPFPSQAPATPALPTQVHAAASPAAALARLAPTRLEVIRELPPQFSSSTYDELEDEAAGGAGVPPSAPEAEAAPDPLALGLELLRPLADVRSQPWGLGCVSLGRVGPPGRASEALVLELRLPRPPAAGPLRRLSQRLRSAAAPREGLARPLGAVPARLADGGPGVWLAWSRAPGSDAACAVPDGGAQPLVAALRAAPPRGGAWRLATARQLCAAVAGLHALGRSHGSLAPRAVWLAPGGGVRLLEAGLAEALVVAGLLREPELLSCLGAEFARYLAPEGWGAARAGGAAADVWALGLVLLEVLGAAAGPPNADCGTLQQLSAKMLPKRGLFAPQVNRDGFYGSLPPATRSVIEACFSADPAERPSANTLLSNLADTPSKVGRTISSASTATEMNASILSASDTASEVSGVPSAGCVPTSADVQAASPAPVEVPKVAPAEAEAPAAGPSGSAKVEEPDGAATGAETPARDAGAQRQPPREPSPTRPLDVPPDAARRAPGAAAAELAATPRGNSWPQAPVPGSRRAASCGRGVSADQPGAGAPRERGRRSTATGAPLGAPPARRCGAQCGLLDTPPLPPAPPRGDLGTPGSCADAGAPWAAAPGQQLEDSPAPALPPSWIGRVSMRHAAGDSGGAPPQKPPEPPPPEPPPPQPPEPRPPEPQPPAPRQERRSPRRASEPPPPEPAPPRPHGGRPWAAAGAPRSARWREEPPPHDPRPPEPRPPEPRPAPAAVEVPVETRPRRLSAEPGGEPTPQRGREASDAPAPPPRPAPAAAAPAAPGAQGLAPERAGGRRPPEPAPLPARATAAAPAPAPGARGAPAVAAAVASPCGLARAPLVDPRLLPKPVLKTPSLLGDVTRMNPLRCARA